MKSGFIGIGAMGSGMAANLLKAGYSLTVYDLDRRHAEPLLEKGACWADSAFEVARASEVVLASLPGPADVDAVALGEQGVLAGLRADGVFIDLSTNSPSSIRRVHARGRELDVHVLDAPVSGGVFGARSGRLAVMVGGDRAAFDRCKPILDSIGDNVVYCGDSGAGSVCKLVNNMIGLGLNPLLAEALTLGVKAGVSLEVLHQVISKSGGNTRKMELNFPRFLYKGNFEPGFALDLGIKDLSLGVGLARELGLPLDFVSLALSRFVEAHDRGWRGQHADAVVKLFEEKAGVELRLPEGL